MLRSLVLFCLLAAGALWVTDRWNQQADERTQRLLTLSERNIQAVSILQTSNAQLVEITRSLDGRMGRVETSANLTEKRVYELLRDKRSSEAAIMKRKPFSVAEVPGTNSQSHL